MKNALTNRCIFSQRHFKISLLFAICFATSLIAKAQNSLIENALTSAEIKGLVDLRLQNSDAVQTWLDGGLSKQRFDKQDSAFQLGQSALDIKADVTDTITLKSSLNGYSDRDQFVDLLEFYAQWKPLPIEGYRIKTKVGAFFPSISLENSATGWTNPWMISSSAINTWIGEEFRTKGFEITLSRPGILHDSAHDFDFIYSIFTANDPAGALIAWRGWSIGDRVTGLSEKINLPDLPQVYGDTGIFNVQGTIEHPFREVDKHTGYYAGANYTYNNWLTLRALHYDNRGDPLGLRAQQWGWETIFDHLAMRMEFTENTTLIAQAMRGSTLWGDEKFGVYADFDSWFLLLSHQINKHRISVRFDSFNITNEDTMWLDNNSEKGHGLALAWQYSVNEHQQLGAEYLNVKSDRPGRIDLHRASTQSQSNGLALTANETSLQVFYRYSF